LAGILIATTPLFVGATAVMFLPSEQPSRKSWAELALGFAGVVGLFGTGPDGNAAAAGLVLLAAASYAAASLLVKARLGGVDSLSTGAFALAIAAIALAPGARATDPGSAVSPTRVTFWLGVGAGRTTAWSSARAAVSGERMGQRHERVLPIASLSCG
jgi:drug/metabolite transporter (DMT)-like permease